MGQFPCVLHGCLYQIMQELVSLFALQARRLMPLNHAERY